MDEYKRVPPKRWGTIAYEVRPDDDGWCNGFEADSPMRIGLKRLANSHRRQSLIPRRNWRNKRNAT